MKKEEKIIKYSNGGSSGPYTLLQNINATPNTTYTISGYVYQPSASAGTALVEARSSANVIFCRAQPTVKDQWTRVSCSFTTGAKDTFISARFGGTVTGPAWFDAIQLQQGALTDYVRN